MDTILLTGITEQKLGTFLTKMGYNVVAADGAAAISDAAYQHVVDLIVADTRSGLEAQETIEFFRSLDATKEAPMVVIGAPSHLRTELKSSSIELLDKTVGVGTIASKIATLLRLRKFAGADERNASISEMNATLRDLIARFAKEKEEARVIQQSLLPSSLPNDDRFQIAVSYRPLDEVGGDWYDARSANGRIALHIADVTGHGLAAALICSMTRLALSAANRQAPNELLREANRLMAPQLPEGRFVTMGSYLYDPASGDLEFARAGHPPGLMLSRSKREVTQLLGDGFPIGFFDEGDYGPGTAKLELSDSLVIFTDGISEAQNRSGETYGFERMSAVLMESSPGASAEELLAALLGDFEAFRDGRILKDDVTVLVLKRLA